MPAYNIFGTPIYSSLVCNSDKLKKELKKRDLKKYTKNTKEKSSANIAWACSVNTGHKENLFLEENLEKLFFNTITPNVTEYVNSIKINDEDNVVLKFEKPWVNFYEKNQYQEEHNHIGGRIILSYCYFYKLPKNCAKFAFINFLGKNRFFGGADLFLNTQQEFFYPNVSENQILIFPCWLDHLVTVHQSKKPRITISGNITLMNENC